MTDIATPHDLAVEIGRDIQLARIPHDGDEGAESAEQRNEQSLAQAVHQWRIDNHDTLRRIGNMAASALIDHPDNASRVFSTFHTETLIYLGVHLSTLEQTSPRFAELVVHPPAEHGEFIPFLQALRDFCLTEVRQSV